MESEDGGQEGQIQQSRHKATQFALGWGKQKGKAWERSKGYFWKPTHTSSTSSFGISDFPTQNCQESLSGIQLPETSHSPSWFTSPILLAPLQLTFHPGAPTEYIYFYVCLYHYTLSFFEAEPILFKTTHTRSPAPDIYSGSPIVWKKQTNKKNWCWYWTCWIFYRTFAMWQVLPWVLYKNCFFNSCNIFMFTTLHFTDVGKA